MNGLTNLWNSINCKPFMIIGLTGLYCAGKNHVGLLLEKQGIPVLDVDKLGHKIIETEAEKITGRFGKKILDPNGKIDRKLLRKLVFGKPEELTDLESIVHPGVNRLTEEWIADKRAGKVSGLETGTCVINAALLHKSTVFDKLSLIIAVYAPFPIRFFRALRRDKRPLPELFKQLVNQKNFPNYRKTAEKAALSGGEPCIDGTAHISGKTGKSPPQLFFSQADIYIIQNSGFSGCPRVLEKRLEAILDGFRHEGL